MEGHESRECEKRSHALCLSSWCRHWLYLYKNVSTTSTLRIIQCIPIENVPARLRYPLIKEASINRTAECRVLWDHRVEQSAVCAAWQWLITALGRAEVNDTWPSNSGQLKASKFPRRGGTLVILAPSTTLKLTNLPITESGFGLMYWILVYCAI